MLFNVPAWFFTNVAASPDQRAEIAQKIASLEDANRQSMIVPARLNTTSQPAAAWGLAASNHRVFLGRLVIIPP